MTPAKRRALEMMLVRGRVATKNTTEHYISGRVAACLEREGLAVWHEGLYEITDLGRAALAVLAVPAVPVEARFVVRPSDACGSIEGAVRDRSWDVINTTTGYVVGNFDRRKDARAEALARNQEES